MRGQFLEQTLLVVLVERVEVLLGLGGSAPLFSLRVLHLPPDFILCLAHGRPRRLLFLSKLLFSLAQHAVHLRLRFSFLILGLAGFGLGSLALQVGDPLVDPLFLAATH